jgi:hypothetical protein
MDTGVTRRTTGRRRWLVRRVVLAAVTVAALAALIIASGVAATNPAVSDDPAATYVEIECGGYDADGQVAEPRAIGIDRAPVLPDGTVDIPAVCGGYTADGEFIGDD